MCTFFQVAVALHQSTLGVQSLPASQLGTSGSGQSAQGGRALGIILPARDFSWVISVTPLRPFFQQSLDISDGMLLR